MKKLKIFIAIFLAIIMIYGFYYRYQRAQWSKVYREIVLMYWGSKSYTGEVAELEWSGKLILDCDIVIYPDQFSGNTYVIDAKGDTIFKYIKKEKE